jgi:hypothetical protein
MEILAEALEQGGFKTFLPHRDGFLYGAIVPDLAKAGYPLEVAQWLARQAIFALDVYQVLAMCAGMVVNLNGRVPDEGAVAEGAMAWTAGKAVVLFKDDERSKIDGLDNPLVAGLGGFRLVNHCEEVPRALARALEEHPPAPGHVDSLPPKTHRIVEQGQRLFESYRADNSTALVRCIIEMFDEFHSVGGPQSPLLR